MRGPIVFCAEETDNLRIPSEYFHADAALTKDAPLAEMFGGVSTIQAGDLKLIPYCLWDNRTAGSMVQRNLRLRTKKFILQCFFE